MTASATSVWNNCLAFIEDNIQPQAFKTWFEPIKPVRLTESALSIQVPSKFFYEWLEEHYEAIPSCSKGSNPAAKINVSGRLCKFLAKSGDASQLTASLLELR